MQADQFVRSTLIDIAQDVCPIHMSPKIPYPGLIATKVESGRLSSDSDHAPSLPSGITGFSEIINHGEHQVSAQGFLLYIVDGVVPDVAIEIDVLIQKVIRRQSQGQFFTF